MVALKCPKCGKSAELPDDLAAGDHRCYSCNVYLEYADPDFIPKRERDFKDQVYTSIIGAMLGACSILSIGVFGGKVGLAVATGVAGALLGCVLGFVSGLREGLGWAALTFDGSWFSFMAKVNMIFGAIGGFMLGILGILRGDPVELIGIGVFGGLVLGGLLGALIAKPKTGS
jgi:hypothetical protein